MEGIKIALTAEEKKNLEQNSICTYCGSNKTHFLVHFSSVCRIDKKGDLIVFDGNLKKVSVGGFRTSDFALRKIVSLSHCCCKSFIRVCENCNRQSNLGFLG